MWFWRPGQDGTDRQHRAVVELAAAAFLLYVMSFAVHPVEYSGGPMGGASRAPALLAQLAITAAAAMIAWKLVSLKPK